MKVKPKQPSKKMEERDDRMKMMGRSWRCKSEKRTYIRYSVHKEKLKTKVIIRACIGYLFPPQVSYAESKSPMSWYWKWLVINFGNEISALIKQDCKEIQPVHPKGDHSQAFIGRSDAEAETPILWPPDVKNWLIGQDPDAGKDWRQEEKGMTEDEMVEWHHQLDGHESE